MAQIQKLESTRRTEIGKHAMKRLRGAGRTPAILYGHGQESVAISLDGRVLRKALDHHARFVELAVDGKVETALVREVEWDTYSQDVLHIDFLRVNADEPIVVTVPIAVRGTPKGAGEGGVLEVFIHELPIKVKPREIPERVEVNVAELKLHDQVLAKQLTLPSGVVLAVDGEKPVCGVVSVKIYEAPVAAAAEGDAAAATAAATPTEPEVVQKKKEKEEEPKE